MAASAGPSSAEVSEDCFVLSVVEDALLATRSSQLVFPFLPFSRFNTNPSKMTVSISSCFFSNGINLIRISAAFTLANESALNPFALLNDNGPNSSAIHGKTESLISPSSMRVRPVTFST